MHPGKDKIETFISAVKQQAANTNFIHHQWFVKYHLEIVDTIAQDLLHHYPQANPDVVKVLTWMHDYGKSIDFDNQAAVTLREGRKLLEKIGFEAGFIDTIIEYVDLLDKKLEIDIKDTPIEVQIVSSADGCSHMVGPFLQLWWYENPHKTFEELMKDNAHKINKDWDRKIVLPEARQAFKQRYAFLLEQSGNLPTSFIK